MKMNLFIYLALSLFIVSCKNNSTEIEAVKEKILKNNEVVFFSSDRDGKATNIFMMTPAGMIVKQITKYDKGEYAATAISPDRNNLLFYRAVPGYKLEVSIDIYIYKIKEDSIIGPITQGHPGNFSPDGKMFVFHRHIFTMEGGYESVYLYDITKKTEKKITLDGKTSFYPQISPDGKYICYESAKFWNRDSISCSQLHLMNINGDFITDLTTLKNGYYAGNGVFSTDGKSIIFHYNEATWCYDICKLDISSRKIDYITKTRFTGNWMSPNYWNPSESDNSGKVYYFSKKYDEINKKYLTQVCLSNIDGTEFKNLTNDSFWNSHPIGGKVSYYVLE